MAFLDFEGLTTFYRNLKNYIDNKPCDTPNEVDDALSSTSTNPVQNRVITEKFASKADNKQIFTQAESRANIVSGENISTIFGKITKWFSDMKTVAFSGDYQDLSNKPDIPTKTSDLVNDSNFKTTDNDTKNTAGSSNSPSKLFLIGATTQSSNPMTYSRDTVYTGIDGCLYSNDIRVFSELIQSSEPTTQKDGDYWLVDYSHFHDYIEAITKSPTCTESGEKTYTCDCGESYTEEITAIGHNYINGRCSTCGALDPDHVHNYTETITKEPTCTEDGEKKYTCVCGNSYIESITANGHNYVNGSCTECGEADPDYVKYEVAPASEYLNWKYTLDNVNKTITFQQYNNTAKTEVIVYGNYEINGAIYKTIFTYTTRMFENKNNIQTIIFSDAVDTSSTSNIIYMSYMFNNCTSLRSVDFGKNFNTSNVTNMDYMFYNCTSLENINFGENFDTSNVTNMKYMFSGCTSMTNLDLSNFDTGKTLNMEGMFYNCISLKNLNISTFDTGNVTNMRSMFVACSEMENLDLSSFYTGNVTDMSYMFSDCSKLTSINVTRNKWITSKANVSSMFYNCGTSSVTYQ